MKKITTLIIIVALTLALGVPAFATRNNAAEMPSADNDKGAEAVEKFEDLQEKFDALSDPQKEQIYKLSDKISGLTQKLVNKYCKYGVLTAEEAEEICEMLIDASERAREEGRMIFGALPRPPCIEAD